jgi:hypothetical protein
MQYNKPTRNRLGLTRTQSLILVILGTCVCVIFGIAAIVLINAMAPPAVPTVAVEATVTPIPMTPTPTLVPAPVLEEGWVSHGQPGDGFTMALPASWIAMDLSAETLDDALAPVKEHVPDIVYPDEGAWSTDVYRDRGLKLSVVDVQETDYAYYAKMDVTCEAIEEPVPLDDFVEEYIFSLPDLGIGILSNERITLPIGEAERLEVVEGADDPYRIFRYLLLQDQVHCSVTFIWDAQAGDTYVPVAGKIMQTFRWAE